MRMQHIWRKALCRPAGLVVVCLALLLAGSGCDAEKRLATPAGASRTPAAGVQGVFAIYLTDPEIPPERLAMQSHLGLAAEPVLTADDIISYVWATHEITLTASGYERLHALRVPTHGISFVVCVDRAPVYAGAFWAGYSSQSYDGVVIDPVLMVQERPVVQIRLGYPGSSFFHGEDPRPDPRLRAALEAAGKLR